MLFAIYCYAGFPKARIARTSSAAMVASTIIGWNVVGAVPSNAMLRNRPISASVSSISGTIKGPRSARQAPISEKTAPVRKKAGKSARIVAIPCVPIGESANSVAIVAGLNRKLKPITTLMMPTRPIRICIVLFMSSAPKVDEGHAGVAQGPIIWQ